MRQAKLAKAGGGAAEAETAVATPSKRGKKISVRLFAGSERKSTVEMVIDRFKDLLKSGELHAGDRLPSEAALAQSLQASRSSIREALKTLVGFGILDVRQGDGTYVSESMSKSLYDHLIFQILATNTDKQYVIEMREILETGVVMLAIQNMTAADLDRLEGIHEEIRALLFDPDFNTDRSIAAETQFHFAMSAATHNPLLEKLYNFTFELFIPSIRRSHEVLAMMKAHSEEMAKIAERDDIITVHGGIMESFRRRDPKMAKRAVKYSLDIWEKYMA